MGMAEGVCCCRAGLGHRFSAALSSSFRIEESHLCTVPQEPLCTCTGISQEFLLDTPKVYRVYIHTTLECSSPLIRPMRARSISKLLTGLRSGSRTGSWRGARHCRP